MLRSFDSRDFPAKRLVDAKHGRRISVCLPARNEEATVGTVVEAIRRDLMELHPVVDELVVVDDGSDDRTAMMSRAAGATVVDALSVLPDYGLDHGKGQALWRGLHVTSGDIVMFCDSDIRDFDVAFVLGLVGPLLIKDDIGFVKGFYERPLDDRPGEGGRVTELMARPLIAALFPELAPLVQPLAGECAARREILEAVPFVGGYGVDLGLLIDVSDRFGPGCIAQCDLGRRVHRNRPLAELGPQALAILQLALNRSGILDGGADSAVLAGLVEDEAGRWSSVLSVPGAEPTVVTLSERPPLEEVPAHRKTA
jgi:glucosyl-3-phosphoglycerate synthase